MTQSIRAVVFDFGGVLTLPPGPGHWRDLLAALEPEARGGDEGGTGPAAWPEERLAALQAAYHARRDAFDRGGISSGEYWRGVLRQLEVPAEDGLTERLFELDTSAWTQSRSELLDWAAGLRAAGFRTGILSNMSSEVLARIEARMGWIGEFSPRVFSCRLGLIKPEAGIYRALLEELALPPEQILFLDDREDNAEAARRLGLAAERFVSLQALLPILQERYALPGLPPTAAGEGRRA